MLLFIRAYLNLYIKEAQKVKSLNLHLIYIIASALLFALGYNSVFVHYDPDQKLTILVLIVAIYLWTLSNIPTGAASILILMLILLLNLVDSVEEAFMGFTSPALYFILILSILSSALIKVGIDEIVINQLTKISVRGPSLLMLIFPFLMIILPIIMPSAFARFKMLLPFIENLNHSFGLKEDSRFMKYSLYVIGLMNQNATIVVYTGGGFPVLAHQLMRDYGVGNFGWLEWILLVAPPLWIGLFIVNVFVRIYLYRTTPDDIIEYAKNIKLGRNEKAKEKDPKVIFVMVSFLLMILTWAFFDQNTIPTLVPPMFLLVIYCLPKINILNNNDITNFDWNNFLLLGSSFSLGLMMESNGTATVIAESLISILDENLHLLLKIAGIGIFVFIFRMIFIMPSSALIVIFPITMSYAEILGISESSLAFLIVFVIGCSNVIPIHAPPSYFAYQTGSLTAKNHYIISIFSTFLFLIIAVLAAYLYW